MNSSWARIRPSRIGWGIFVLLALLAGSVLPRSGVSAAPRQAPLSVGCRHATGPFRVSGTKVLASNGRVFVPYGITVPGLANFNDDPSNPAWKATLGDDLRKIDAAAQSWCANTVRLQVSQDNLLGLSGVDYYPAFMKAIGEEVSRAETDHLVVVINDQTETADQLGITYQKGPTGGTETFWKDIIAKYRNDPQVIFDLFNEPRTCTIPCSSSAPTWGLWRNGGSFDGHTYLGMETLARSVRDADNQAHPHLLWVEGPNYAASFAGLIRNHGLLDVPGVVYSFHHPGPSSVHNSSAWYLEFGYLINTGVAPVVDGEWTNFRGGYCWSDAPKSVPVYFSYLAGHGIGMTAFQLAKGLLTTSNTDLASPTTFTNARYPTWSCAPIGTGNDPNPSNQGAGAAIQRWYRQQNR